MQTITHRTNLLTPPNYYVIPAITEVLMVKLDEEVKKLLRKLNLGK
jgi:hypothetical protein